jgi:acetyl-CoA carboxylase carboxyltransferase component
MEEKARIGGGLERRENERQRGKMTAGKRVLAALGPGTFVEINMMRKSRLTSDDCQFTILKI